MDKRAILCPHMNPDMNPDDRTGDLIVAEEDARDVKHLIVGNARRTVHGGWQEDPLRRPPSAGRRLAGGTICEDLPGEAAAAAAAEQR